MPTRPAPSSTAAFGDAAPDVILDLRGLKCPLPVLHTRRALARAAAGAHLEIRCSDPLAALDIPNLVRETGDVLLVATRRDREVCFRIRKAEAARGRAVVSTEDPSRPADVDEPQ